MLCQRRTKRQCGLYWEIKSWTLKNIDEGQIEGKSAKDTQFGLLFWAFHFSCIKNTFAFVSCSNPYHKLTISSNATLCKLKLNAYLYIYVNII